MKKIFLLRNGFITILMAWVVFGSNVSAQVYPSGIVGYWKLDNSLVDELGIYTGTMGPYGSYVDGIVNQGLHGAKGCSNPYAAKVDNFPNLDSFTIETWIKPACPPDSWQGSLTITKWYETGYYQGTGFMLFTTPNPYGSSDYKFSLEISDSINKQSINSSSLYSCNNWHHVVAIREYGQKLKLYVNGQEAANAVSDNIIGSIANTESLIFHGFTSGGCGWGMSAITMDIAGL